MNPPATEENTSLYPLAQEAVLANGYVVLFDVHTKLVHCFLTPLCTVPAAMMFSHNYIDEYRYYYLRCCQHSGRLGSRE